MMATKKKTKKKTTKNAAPAVNKVDDLPADAEDLAEQQEVKDTIPAINMAANSLGKALMAAVMAELVDAGVWNKYTDGGRRAVVDRLSRRIRHEARVGFAEVLTSGVPACMANLGKVVFTGDGIQGTLKIDKHVDRHELSDFAGKDVLILLTDQVESHLAEIEDMVDAMIEAQQQLPLEDRTMAATEARATRSPKTRVCPKCNGETGEYVEDCRTDTGMRWVDCDVCQIPPKSDS